MRVLLLSIAIWGCGSSPPTAEPVPERDVPVEARYFAVVPDAAAAAEGVEGEALAGARSFLERELRRTGGAPGEGDGSGAPVFVFHVNVGSIEAHDSGRTRASVEVIVRTLEGGRIVGALAGTATAFVERSAPLAERQLRAIEGALQGALERLPELLDRVAREPS